MYAIVESGSRQYRVEPGQELLIERPEATDPQPKKVVLEKVLAIGADKELKVGRPWVEGAQVECLVVGVEKGPKLVTLKFKRRKNYRKKIGHRQTYWRLRVEKIHQN